jgi:hypothetical protein
MGMMQSKVPTFEIMGMSILHKSNLHNWSFDWGPYGINLMFDLEASQSFTLGLT